MLLLALFLLVDGASLRQFFLMQLAFASERFQLTTVRKLNSSDPADVAGSAASTPASTCHFTRSQPMQVAGQAWWAEAGITAAPATIK